MKRIGYFPTGVLIIVIVMTLIAYPMLPAEIAIHFDSDFSPDTFAQKWLGLLFIPILMLAFLVTEYYGIEKVKNDILLEFKYCFYLVLVFLAVMQGSVILYSLGYDLTTAKMSLAIAGLIMWLIAHYLLHSKNFFKFLTLIGFKKVDAWARNRLKDITVSTLTVAGVICFLRVFLSPTDPSLFFIVLFLIISLVVFGSGVYLNKKQ
ncbi:DUF1648 domain-containing protein [Listeria grayi]|uniref:DUF1648 domain-containing protein n=1 Tax=Listeria grayi TaxID=1641 RepID=UPI00162406D0|nr:DUF1648 domain-containing protein [Listeria grayi]MBC1922663.1 SdpI family protein [Listeria grayi]